MSELPPEHKKPTRKQRKRLARAQAEHDSRIELINQEPPPTPPPHAHMDEH